MTSRVPPQIPRPPLLPSTATIVLRRTHYDPLFKPVDNLQLLTAAQKHSSFPLPFHTPPPCFSVEICQEPRRNICSTRNRTTPHARTHAELGQPLRATAARPFVHGLLAVLHGAEQSPWEQPRPGECGGRIGTGMIVAEADRFGDFLAVSSETVCHRVLTLMGSSCACVKSSSVFSLGVGLCLMGAGGNEEGNDLLAVF